MGCPLQGGALVVLALHHISRCQRLLELSDIELECRGLQGFWGYLTYNAYVCPHCRKQNHALSTGAVIAARLRSGAHV